MYHGGTSFGRVAGGNLNQPKWGHLQKLHVLIRSVERTLTYGSVRKIDYGNMVECCRHQNIILMELDILPDCNTEAYNTAKVNTQISVMEKMRNEADDGDEPYSLTWGWKPEHFTHIKKKWLSSA
ncbi:beta-galactosidase 7-like [Prunus yedoensis var. nudiflora]|uniref:Beta-galactosidase 7-like n=1 Tax=Prunus yedoensis var. nudiflora TaxID=2094558 RepID=A0A314UIS8_PRUYE|nr:beta-galactosidase 7-like [Prunus yedoensis var. nudiflora]